MSSAYFFCLEKKRSTDRRISALREADGSIVSSVDDLCRSVMAFYSSLFSSESTDPAPCEALLANILSKLPDDQSTSCEGLLDLDEC